MKVGDIVKRKISNVKFYYKRPNYVDELGIVIKSRIAQAGYSPSVIKFIRVDVIWARTGRSSEIGEGLVVIQSLTNTHEDKTSRALRE
jgi:hypothetical protein